MTRSYANRCSTYEWRDGRRVRCVLSKQHIGMHINRGRQFDIVGTELAWIADQQGKVICGKVWHPDLNGLGHVCYEHVDHRGAHRCWCEVEAQARRAA